MFGKKAFFKVPLHQQFDYKPMHYDPQKEEMKNRIKELKELQEGGIEGTKARISSGMRSGHLGDKDYRKKIRQRSNITFIAVIVMLIVLTYFLLSVYLPELNKFLE